MNNIAKKFGLAVYGTGFTYTFCQGFLDSTVRKENFKGEKTMLDYTMYSIMGCVVGAYSGFLWPTTLVLKALDKQ